MDNIFLQISTLLGITVSIALVMRALRQPLMVAYLIAGIVSGPLFLNILHGDEEIFAALSQFGVVLLLFVVGLSLNFSHIKQIGKASIVGGLSQVFFTAAIGFGILSAMNFEGTSALYLAAGLTFSSTIIIVKLLSDKKDVETTYGRYTIGLMVVQDVVAILLMMIIVSLSSGGQTPSQAVIELVGKSLMLVALVYIAARFVLPPMLDRVAKSAEFLFIFTVAWCFGVASILHVLGFSIEIGAIVAGLTLGSSPYQLEISSRIKPLRDFFIVLFFIILGAEMELANLSAVIWPALILSAFILIGNPFVLYRSFRALKFTRRNSFLIGLTAAQVSEFGFVLLVTGKSLGQISGPEIEIFTIVALITIIVSSYTITYNEQLYQKILPFLRLFGKEKEHQKELPEEIYDVWIIGYHRVGWKVCAALEEKGMSFAVVDFNPKTISRLKTRGIKAFFGDAADVEFLSALPFDKAKMVVSTIPEVDDQKVLIRHVRTRNNRIKIIANLYKTELVKELYAEGADYVMMPHFLGGNWIANVLKEKPWTKRTFDDLRKDQSKELRMSFAPTKHEM